MIQIGGKTYELIQNYKDAWDAEAFKQRYSEVLDRYDYIIGDWGYEKLRLKGFLRDNHPKANRDTAYSGITDYINEYCNFGCKYFVLQKAKDSGTKEQSKEHAQESNKEHGKGHVKAHAKDQTKEQNKEQSKELSREHSKEQVR
ncbi:YutD family protein [Paenibacillus antibioticophila]|uniref:YutD family protein n=1 Tax=Paenibacillus antibioticophila TaxID=1274374 RepID=UPI000A522BA9|nr:YutD family protein [Paenibacillus antibioticophila]